MQKIPMKYNGKRFESNRIRISFADKKKISQMKTLYNTNEAKNVQIGTKVKPTERQWKKLVKKSVGFN